MNVAELSNEIAAKAAERITRGMIMNEDQRNAITSHIRAVAAECITKEINKNANL